MAAYAAFLESNDAIYQRFVMHYILSLFETHQGLVALVAATAGGIFALWRWTVDQKWRRVQHAQSLIKEFLGKESTAKALEILDVIDEKVEFRSREKHSSPVTIKITNEFLIGALSTFDQKKENTPDELVVRWILDEFFEDLSIFQSHIDAGLIKTEDTEPYLEYWFQELTGVGRCHDDPAFAAQVTKYLEYFRYRRVLVLAKNLRHPFQDPPRNSESK